MAQLIGYSALDLDEETHLYNENECYIADSVESMKQFIDQAWLSKMRHRIMTVRMVDILADYGVSNGGFCMEPFAFSRFQQAARAEGVSYNQEKVFDNLVNVNVVLPQQAEGSPLRDGPEVFVSEAEPVADRPEIETAAFIRFPTEENRFLLVKQFCDNPDCPANDVFIDFIEMGTGTKQVPDGLSFQLRVDIKAWKEIDPPARSERVERRLAEHRFSREDVLHGMQSLAASIYPTQPAH